MAASRSDSTLASLSTKAWTRAPSVTASSES